MRMRLLWIPVAAIALAAGCNGDVASQLTTNAQFKEQVLSAIAARPELAAEAVEHIFAADSSRTRVLEGMLHNDAFAQQLLTRVAMTPGAVDMVLATAVQDSSMREHVVTLVKGMTMAGGAGKR